MTTSLRRLWAHLTLFVARLTDTGVEAAIGRLFAARDHLDVVIGKSEDAIDATSREVTASFARQAAVREAEAVLRDGLYEREDRAIETMQRAKRVRERIAALLD